LQEKSDLQKETGDHGEVKSGEGNEHLDVIDRFQGKNE
jgi:hypothetical protein